MISTQSRQVLRKRVANGDCELNSFSHLVVLLNSEQKPRGA